MNPIRHIRRLAVALAGLAGALLAFGATPAFATLPPPVPGRPAGTPAPPVSPGWYKHPPLPPRHIHQPVHQASAAVPVHTVVIGGMPGWQIALIALGAAVLAYRTWTARRKPATAAA
jgi:hypothetical protein